jgi:Domain of Unknown Function (DUF1080)
MRWFATFAALATLVLLTAATELPLLFMFSKDDLGKLPAGWKADHTGEGKGSLWKVVADDTSPTKTGYALAQIADTGTGHFYNLCVADDAPRFTDLEASVAFKAIKGKEDQGGGIVWRYQNADNYYVSRMNPLEDNFRVYKVVAGKRMQLATTEDNVKAAANEWHTVKIVMVGNHIECFFDGKKLLDVKDDTFKEAGKVGLWSKADAQTRFDKLTMFRAQ